MNVFPSIPRQLPVAALLFLSIPFFSSLSSAQDGPAGAVESLFDQSDMPGDVEQLLQELGELRRRKIPVNTATPGDLLQLPFLSAGEAEAIVDFRERRGPISSLKELREAVGAETAERIAPFLRFDLLEPKAPPKKNTFGGSWYGRYFREIPEREGITEGKYAGENYKLYNRLTVGIGDVEVKGVMEKDIGEPDIDDFSSLSVAYAGEGFVRELIAGNYTVNAGQGLLFGQSRYLSKGVDPLGVKLPGRLLKPYASSAENGFMQGAAATVANGPFRLTAFYSDNRIDASTDDGTVTTIRTSGYHRTESEIEHHDNVSERVAGLNVRYAVDAGAVSGIVGGTWAGYRYGMPLEENDGEEGWKNMAGVEADLLVGRVNLFGEAAFAGRDGELSWICGAGFPLSPDIRTVLAVRDYHPRFFSPFAGAFAERADDGANEEGYYVGIEARLSKAFRLSAYYDVFRFPELSRYYGLSSTGDEAKVFLSWRQSPSLTLELLLQNQYKEESRKLSDDSGLQYYTPVPFVSNRARLDLLAKLDKDLTLKTRGEIKLVEGEYPDNTEHSKGWLVYEQASWRTGSLSLVARYSRFHTENYDSAIYVYENDLPLVFNLKSYYGRGEAFFALLGLEIMKNFDLSARYEKAWYANREAYGSGNDLRPTSSPSSWHLGCALRF